ncbi:GIY-YIG nuclease family protein [Streptomyces sp. NBC_01549]|uniref:GIY-YIG nuclease family protein n=1 Tax=Streptomyces sp. NBC_01549 TaxID=2975874 RepID=UPI00225409DD|nr:GIY-YIG nuclease family protein [Streptomyces sp. NBC_01549]MCX4596109.1 GIY-YIG nuclease family protein [Streptomyces sp. NBC_01549]
MDAVDQDEPAFVLIAAELQRIRRTGGDLDAETINQAIADGRRKYAQHLQDEEDRRPGRIPSSIVYYARRGKLVKIGYTSKPHKRFGGFLPDEILAWEPGGRAEEAERHQQFRALRLSNAAEYFRRDDALEAHIASVREEHGAPNPTWPTLQNLSRRPSRARLPELPVTTHLVTLEAGTRQLGIRLGTARVWVHRKKLHHVLHDENGIQLYFLSDLKSLANRGRKAA